MINANELRTGNWVCVNGAYDNYGGFEVDQRQIVGILEDYVYLSVMLNITTPFENLQPIQVTPEILQRCGFEKFTDWFILKIFALSPATINISLVHNKTTFGNNEEYEIKHIQYLHNLQNLHLDLSGQELEIKELKNP